MSEAEVCAGTQAEVCMGTGADGSIEGGMEADGSIVGGMEACEDGADVTLGIVCTGEGAHVSTNRECTESVMWTCTWLLTVMSTVSPESDATPRVG